MEDTVLLASRTPKLDELLTEYQQCGPYEGFWNKLADADEVRFATWDNQSSDGKKYSTTDVQAFPWEGASDCRIFLADDVINENVAVETVAFWRSVLRAQGVGLEDAGVAAAATKVLNWFLKNRQAESLRREVELSSQYRHHYGFTVLHPTWQREIRLRNYQIDFATVAQLVPLMANVIADPQTEDTAVELFSQVYQAFVERNVKAIQPEEIPSLPASTIRAAVRRLRLEGQATLPVPYVCSNDPQIVALKPWVDVFFHPDVIDLQRARVFVKHFLTEAEIRAKILTEGWNEEWVEAVCAYVGQFSNWTNTPDGTSTWTWSSEMPSPFVEVLYAYYPALDENNVPGVYCTIMHAQATKDRMGDPLYAKHGLLEYAHGMMPFICSARERWSRRLASSRSVPEIAATQQREVKVQRDALVDRTSYTTLPAVLVPMAGPETQYRFGPAVQVPYLPGRKPEFMESPRPANDSSLVIENITSEVDNYFGRLSEKVPPARIQAKQQKMVNDFLSAWAEALKQEWLLIQQYLAPEDYERISGAPPPSSDPRELSAQYDLTLSFDVRELDVDYTMAKLEAVSKTIVPEDVAGIVDRAKLTQLKLMAIDPTYARELITDQGAASQKIFEGVRNDIAQMFLGNPALPVEQDPTAGQKLRYASDIVSANPNYTAAIQQGGRFAELMQNYAKNLGFSVQQQENAKIGRIGVKPEIAL